MENDIKHLSILFEYLYRMNGCDNIAKVIEEELNESLSGDDAFRLYRILCSTGFIKEYNYAYGNHRHISLNEEGFQMMLEHKSYLSYLDNREKKDNQNSKSKDLEIKNLILDVEKKKLERRYKPWEIIFAIFSGLFTMLYLIEHIIKFAKGISH